MLRHELYASMQAFGTTFERSAASRPARPVRQAASPSPQSGHESHQGQECRRLQGVPSDAPPPRGWPCSRSDKASAPGKAAAVPRSSRDFHRLQKADGLPCWSTRADVPRFRSEEHTSELQSLMRISYAVFCLKKKKKTYQ